MKVCVVGGGPAGLAAAIHAARAGAAATLLEKNDRFGVKLMATGGGHCNIANRRPLAEWPALFGRRGRFIAPALDALDGDALDRWMRDLGQPLASPDGFHLFPASNSAKAVRDALVREAAAAGVTLLASRRVCAVSPVSGGFRVAGEGWTEACDRLVLACGGNSYPATGSTWDGVRMAEELGHRAAPPVPGLVGLRADNLDADLAGLALRDAEAAFTRKGAGTFRGRGELLLTHGGVSGPAVLDMSATVAGALAAGGGATLRLCWLAGRDAGWWLERFARWRRGRGGASLAALLKEYLPARLARWLCRRAGAGDEARAADLPGAARDRLAEFLAGFPARIVASEGWDKAMITRGGVDVRDVDPRTLESRRVPGLFFAGEMLDVDGPCGGYNLHWAFAGGALAGRAAAGCAGFGESS